MKKLAKKLTKRVLAFQKENDRELDKMHRRFEANWQRTDPNIPHAVLKKRNHD